MPADPAKTDLAEAVARGGALMDRRAPGWARRVKLTTLDVENPYRCPLGQRFGSYYRGLAELGLGLRRSQRFGFCVSPPSRYAELNRLWADEIRRRRKRRAS